MMQIDYYISNTLMYTVLIYAGEVCFSKLFTYFVATMAGFDRDPLQ